MTPKHTIIDMNKRNVEMLKKAHEFQPRNYEELISLKGIGTKTIRSLALVSELVYGTEINWKDPVKYSFAVGGKDKIPYEIDRKHYDETIDIIKNAINDAKLGDKERLVKGKKINIIKNLNKKLVKKLMQDFNLGIGEAGTLSGGINKECEVVATDNKQGRKACIVNGLKLIGSIDIIVALHKLRRINKNNAISGLNRLREFGWFHDYLIDNALEDIKNA